MSLLLSSADLKKLNSLHLKTPDFVTVMKAAVRLALGEDPDEEDQGE